MSICLARSKLALLCVVFFAIVAVGARMAGAGTRCAIATGTLNCSSNPALHSDVEVFLMDDDGIGNYDDQMGWSTSDEFGHFRVEGCGYDFLSDPDPYVKIYTKCNSQKFKYIKTKVRHTFAPDIIDYGVVDLD